MRITVEEFQAEVMTFHRLMTLPEFWRQGPRTRSVVVDKLMNSYLLAGSSELPQIDETMRNWMEGALKEFYARSLFTAVAEAPEFTA